MSEQTERNLYPSTEVVGILSENQKVEFAFLGGQIIEAERKDIKDPEHVEQVKVVVADCLVRGLKILGKVWFKPGESIADAFDAGLSLRERVIKDLQDLEDSGDKERLFSKDENDNLTRLLGETGVFSKDLSYVEEVLDIAKVRSEAIEKLHRRLFTVSNLAPTATVLREEAKSQAFGGRIVTNEEIEDRLYRNLLIHMSVYPNVQPSLFIEPKDVAALGDIFDNESARESSKSRAIDTMRSIASKLGLDEESIGIYSANMFDAIADVRKNVDISELKNSNMAIFTDKILRSEEEELSPDLQEAETITISNNELEKAKAKFDEIIRLEDEHQKVLIKSEQDFDEAYGTEIANRQIQISSSLTPFELVFCLKEIKQRGLDWRFEEEFVEFVPVETYVDAMKYTQAKKLENDDGSSIEGFDEAYLGNLNEEVENKVIIAIGSGELDLKPILDKIPNAVLIRLITFPNLNEESRTALINMDPKKWITLCQQVRIDYSGKAGSVSDLNELIFPPGYDNFKDYLAAMPEEKQKEIILGISRIITF